MPPHGEMLLDFKHVSFIYNSVTWFHLFFREQKFEEIHLRPKSNHRGLLTENVLITVFVE